MNYFSNQVLQSIIDFIIIIGIFGGVAIGIETKKYGFILLTLVSLGLLFFLHMTKKKKTRDFLKKRIKEQWGKEHIEKREFKNIEKLFHYLLEKEKKDFIIDDITWKDLNMDSVFSKIDHTKSMPGKQYLYNILRTPIFNKRKLEKRNEVINSLLNNKELSQEIQYILHFLDDNDGKGIFKFFHEGINVDTKPAIIFNIFSYIPLLIIAMIFINPGKALIVAIFLISINNLLYQSTKKKIYEEMDVFLYLGNILKCADNILKLDTVNIDLNQEELKEMLKKVGVVRKNIAKINYNETLGSDMEIIIHYYNMMILKEPKVFYKTVKLINRYKDEFFQIYNLIGKIDAYISIASYKDSLDYYTEPIFVEDKSKFYLETEGIYHPLLDNPVSYSFVLNDMGALVTGSNASGKSTFLRTIGINLIFSETLYFVLANNYSSSYFKLLTSIGTTDNIVEGDSYFMAEAKSLKRILDILDPTQPVLCILDEIFRGTNTAERISAAKESLNYMIERNCCVIAATHDLELTNLVSERYNNYHFRETIEENDIKFDYILREGPCTTRNAIAILKHLGYPVEIYEKSMAEAKRYLIK